jgi:hypothetical protein
MKMKNHGNLRRRMIMKKLVVLMLVLGICSVTNAGLVISVNGVENPPDTTIELRPSDNAVIDIHGLAPAQPMGTFYFGINLVGGEYGSLDIRGATLHYGGTNQSIVPMDPDIAGMLGLEVGGAAIELVDLVPPPAVPKPLLGRLVDNITFHCDGYDPLHIPTDVTLSLFDIEGNLLDTQVIHQIPEPITIALLGLGGLFLRRRK